MARHGENIRKRTDGRWEARYIERYENGKARYKYVYAPTYGEVKLKRNILMKEAVPKASSVKSAQTFEALALMWLDSVRLSVKESTYSRYIRSIKKYILPRIGGMQMLKLDTVLLNSLTDMLLRCGGTNGKPLSPKTVSDILTVLKACLKYGRVNGFPCPDLSSVRQPKIKAKEMCALSVSDKSCIDSLIWNEDTRLGLGIILSRYTGMRIGEVCALRWSDIDLDSGVIYVSKTVERIANTTAAAKTKTKVIISEPKTSSSVRIIPIAAVLVDHLKKYKSKDIHYILTDSVKPTEPHTFYIRYKRFLRRNNLGDYTFHALRHTFATDCVELGFDAKALSEILGHSSVTTTLKCYVHPTLESKRQKMEKMVSTQIRGQNSCQTEEDILI